MNEKTRSVLETRLKDIIDDYGRLPLNKKICGEMITKLADEAERILQDGANG